MALQLPFPHSLRSVSQSRSRTFPVSLRQQFSPRGFPLKMSRIRVFAAKSQLGDDLRRGNPRHAVLKSFRWRRRMMSRCLRPLRNEKIWPKNRTSLACDEKQDHLIFLAEGAFLAEPNCDEVRIDLKSIPEPTHPRPKSPHNLSEEQKANRPWCSRAKPDARRKARRVMAASIDFTRAGIKHSALQKARDFVLGACRSEPYRNPKGGRE